MYVIPLILLMFLGIFFGQNPDIFFVCLPIWILLGSVGSGIFQYLTHKKLTFIDVLALSTIGSLFGGILFIGSWQDYNKSRKTKQYA